MISENIPYLYNRNGIYYYRTRTKWLSLKTRCKAKAFQSLCKIVSSAMNYTEPSKQTLVTDNARRSIPLHPRLIELGILDWVVNCKAERLFHEWKPVKGSYSHAASRWFSRNNPFKSEVKGQKASVDFHSLRHTVATELKVSGIPAISMITKFSDIFD